MAEPIPISVISGRGWMAPHRWIWKDEEVLKPTSLWNLATMIEFHPALAGMLQYNDFTAQVLITRGLPGDKRRDFPREIRDEDEVDFATWLNVNGLAPGIANTASVMRSVAFRNKIDPLRAWLDGLQWDGKDRADRWLTRYAGAEDSEYVRTVARKFLISAVARACEPGCKCDTMPVFEGPQGLKKSTMVRTLCGAEYFSDQIGDIGNKDSQAMIQGKWMVEVPEMDKFGIKEANTVKDFLSRQEDRYRPSYGRNVIKRPRRCVFAGTINPMIGSGYIKDPTGARRFWPVVCTEIDLDGLAADREQLWAEAYWMWSIGQSWWIDADEKHIVAAEQEDRIDTDIWEQRVSAWIGGLYNGPFTVSQALSDAVLVPIERQDHKAKMRMSGILTTLKCVRERGMIDGKQQRVYRREAK